MCAAAMVLDKQKRHRRDERQSKQRWPQHLLKDEWNFVLLMSSFFISFFSRLIAKELA